jgi:guanylate cyclase
MSYCGGSVIGGVVGHSKYSFDIWGNSVNLAARMEN